MIFPPNILAWIALWSGNLTPLPDVPANHWIYLGFSTMKRDGLLIGYPERLLRGQGAAETRMSLVSKLLFATHAYDSNAREALRKLNALRVSPKESEVREEAAADFLNVRDARRNLKFFGRIEGHFSALVTKSRKYFPNYAPSASQREHLADEVDRVGPIVLGSRFRTFSDLPCGHWASEAVGDLRVLDLLDGYADNRFRG